MQVRRVALLAATMMAASAMVVDGPAATAARSQADLVVAAVGKPPATVKHGSAFSLGATVANKGRAAAKQSSLRFYLSKDRTRGTDDILGGTVAVKKIAARKKKTVSGRVGVPWEASGPYWVIACADATKKVKESKEGNNCRISKTQVDVDADLHADLTGTLTFLDTGQKTDADTGKTTTWNRTGSATISISIDGDPNDPNEELFKSTGSSYQRSGTTTAHEEDTYCVRHSERTETGGGALAYTGDPYTSDITGHFTRTDLGGVRLGLFMRANWNLTDTSTGQGSFPCDSTSKTTTGTGLIVSDIELEQLSATARAIRYRVAGWKGEMGTTSDWDKVEGELTLTLR